MVKNLKLNQELLCKRRLITDVEILKTEFQFIFDKSEKLSDYIQLEVVA